MPYAGSLRVDATLPACTFDSICADPRQSLYSELHGRGTKAGVLSR